MKVLVTGVAGFIGFHVARALLERGDEVIGIDNLNDYYEVSLKHARLKELEPYGHHRRDFTYIELLEQALGRTTHKELLPLQPGDVEHTYADVTELIRDTGYAPQVSIEEGITRFVAWYRAFYTDSV